MFEWDEKKSEKNRNDRGFGFEKARELDWANGVTQEDTRRDYGERRFRTFARAYGYAYCVAWTPRNGKIRIISMRGAHEKEASRYGS